MPQIVLKLLVEPAFGAGVEGDGEADGHFGADAGAGVENRGQSFSADAQGSGGLSDGQVQGCQAQCFKDLSGVRWVMHLHR
jgi:hypothetical protein